MGINQGNVEDFYSSHLAFIRAEEGSREETEAREKRDRILAKFTQIDFSNAIAIAIGIRNTLVRMRESLPESPDIVVIGHGKANVGNAIVPAK